MRIKECILISNRINKIILKKPIRNAYFEVNAFNSKKSADILISYYTLKKNYFLSLLTN